jgi:di/tripeptidase
LFPTPIKTLSSQTHLLSKLLTQFDEFRKITRESKIEQRTTRLEKKRRKKNSIFLKPNSINNPIG